MWLITPNINQKYIDELKLEIEEMGILAPITDTGFDFSFKGRVTKSQSFDSFVDFEGPMNVYWENSLIGAFIFPTISLSNDSDLFSKNTFKIMDEARFGDFTVHQLNNETFNWTLTGKPIITAFGFSKNHLSFTKNITLPGECKNSDFIFENLFI